MSLFLSGNNTYLYLHDINNELMKIYFACIFTCMSWALQNDSGYEWWRERTDEARCHHGVHPFAATRVGGSRGTPHRRAATCISCYTADARVARVGRCFDRMPSFSQIPHVLSFPLSHFISFISVLILISQWKYFLDHYKFAHNNIHPPNTKT